MTTVCSSYNHNKCVDPDCDCKCHVADNSRLLSEIKFLREAFEMYGHHLEECHRRSTHECDCGYDDAWYSLVDDRRGTKSPQS